MTNRKSRRAEDVAAYKAFGVDLEDPESKASKRGLSIIGDNLFGNDSYINPREAVKRLKEGESFAPGPGLAMIRTERFATNEFSGAGRDGRMTTPGSRDLTVYGRVGPTSAPAAGPTAPPPPAPVLPTRPRELRPSQGFGGYGSDTFKPPAIQKARESAPQFQLSPGQTEVIRTGPVAIRRAKSRARRGNRLSLGTNQLRIGTEGAASGRPTPRIMPPTRMERNVGLGISPGFYSGRTERTTGLGIGR